jgi:uncharacterized spore protein YtfJ
MADTVEDAETEARADAKENGLTRLAQSLGANAAANAVFGTPVEREGVTVIPVARVRWGFGGGGGRGPGGKRRPEIQDGWGGGGGVQAAPLGFIEVKDGGAQYRRVHDPLRLAIAALLLPLSFAASAAVTVATFAALAHSMKGMFSLPDLPWPFRRRRG